MLQVAEVEEMCKWNLTLIPESTLGLNFWSLKHESQCTNLLKLSMLVSGLCKGHDQFSVFHWWKTKPKKSSSSSTKNKKEKNEVHLKYKGMFVWWQYFTTVHSLVKINV